LEDDEDAVMETPKDSPRLEWWEETERKDEEKEDEMLEEQEAQLESFATARTEERTRAAVAQAVLRSPLRTDMAAYRPARSFRRKICRGCTHLEGRCGEAQGI
jgi:hypothetical protein